MEKHTESHTRKQKVCHQCGKIFDSNIHFKEHTSKYAPVKLKVKRGKLKKKKSPAQYVLSTWEMDSIQDKSWTGYPWACQTCGLKFPDVLVLRIHTKQMHRKCFDMKCADCTETMDSYRGFVYHVKKHRPFLK